MRKKNEVVEYSLWLNMLKDYRPLIIDDEYTVSLSIKGVLQQVVF